MKTIYTPDTLFDTVEEVIACIKQTLEDFDDSSRLIATQIHWQRKHQQDLNRGC